MQMTVSVILNVIEEIANASNYPKIQLFTVSLTESAKPVEELLDITLNWSVTSPKSIAGPT
jgi:hypothetical protein